MNGTFLRQFTSILLIFFISLIITSCASSEAARDASNNIDLGVQNAKKLVSGNGNIADSYQNTNQTTKGALIGGTAGAITGAFAGGIGAIPGAATGAVLGASYGKYIDSRTTFDDRLKNRGANIIILGDQILIVIPSARLFHPMTAELKPDSYSTLEMVTQFINRYTKMLVKVAAYTNDTGSERVDLALSDQQAQSVAKFLSVSGVNARVLYAKGYGGTKLVSKNTLDWDESDNYRIEITLEKLYV